MHKSVSTVAAGGATLALAAAMTLGGAALSASAENIYVTFLDTEGSSYPTGWFTGTITNGVEGPDEFTATGLAVTGKKQILYGTPPTNDLTDLAMGVITSWSGGDWYFQIPVFGNPGGAVQEYTTLVPVAPNTTQGNYRTTGPIYAPNGINIIYPAGSIATLQEFEGVFTSGNGYKTLAYGYFWDTGVSGVLQTSSYLTTTSLFVIAPPSVGGADPNAPALPATGRDVAPTLLLGGVAVLFGAVWVLTARRRAVD